jgi:hypothetical protein
MTVYIKTPLEYTFLPPFVNGLIIGLISSHPEQSEGSRTKSGSFSRFARSCPRILAGGFLDKLGMTCLNSVYSSYMARHILLILLILLVLVGFSGFFFIYQTQYMVGRASVTLSSFSVENSYVFSTPLRAAANGQEKIRITVFILNSQGLGVLGKKVELTAGSTLIVETVQGLTDNLGKAIFDVSSQVPGDHYIEVMVDGKPLIQKAHINFD